MKNKPTWKKEHSLFSSSLLFLQGTCLFFVLFFFFPPLHCPFPLHSCVLQRVCCCRITRSSYKSHSCHSSGLTNCYDLDTLSEGVLWGWVSVLPDSPPRFPCCHPAEPWNFPAVLGQCSALLCTGEGLHGEGLLSTCGKLNSTAPHPSIYSLFSEMKLRGVKQTALENQQLYVSPNSLIRLQRLLIST